MHLRYVGPDAAANDAELLAVAVVQGTPSVKGALARVDAAVGGSVARALSVGDMRGHATDEVMVYRGTSGPKRVLLLGVGKQEELTAEVVRRMAGRAVRAAEK